MFDKHLLPQQQNCIALIITSIINSTIASALTINGFLGKTLYLVSLQIDENPNQTEHLKDVSPNNQV